MVYFQLSTDTAIDGVGLEQALAVESVLIHAVGPRRIRLVVHYWVDDEAVDRAVDAIRRATSRE
jgi:threonine aldolase